MSEEQVEPDLDKQERKIQMLRTTNAALSREIEGYGIPVDLGTARIEAFILFMVEAGHLTRAEQLDEQEAWERALKPQLVIMRDDIKAQIERVQKQRREAEKKKQPEKPSGLIVVGQSYKNKDKEQGEQEAQSDT